jgi:hypothetical protein
VPSQHVHAYHPCMTMGSDVSWDVYGDHGIPSRGDAMDTLDMSEMSASLGEDGAPWHPNAAKKCGTGGKPSSVGGSVLLPHAVL